LFDNIWIQPAAGDAGGAIGAALLTWHQYLNNERNLLGNNDSMKGTYLGPKYENNTIESFLKTHHYLYQELTDHEIPDMVADLIGKEKVVGWFQGRMEFGPRALGARSIIGDARSASMQKTMNLKIKYRESFRPFAPSVLVEDISDYFEIDRESPYMLLVADIKKERQIALSDEQNQLTGLEKLNLIRSDIPAVTHIDYSARIQSVNKATNPLYHQMISRFKEKYGCPVIINTSFNVRGEPIVCSPEDAYRCFMRTEMDYLIIGNFLLDKQKQTAIKNDKNWKEEFVLD